MPDYLTLYSGDSRLRSTHLDNLSFVSSISNLNKSFFIRSHTLWNFLPFDLRNSMRPSQFKVKFVKHYWNMAATDNEQSEDEWSFQSSDSIFKFKNSTPKYTSCRKKIGQLKLVIYIWVGSEVGLWSF